ncbi:MAG: hypothetical protein H6883_12130 [Rhodobiaceae bacterium]|nr:hypothetical protein [Rhodobiaceae bacterium]MCC0056874.1 hypothetical protein [Rhodobiaceae bacterium]
MLPSVAQQISAIKSRFEETIIPEIPEQAKFARDQAQFILVTLSWLLEVHEHQYRFEVVENHQYRSGVADLVAIAQGSAGMSDLLREVSALLASPAPKATEAMIPLSTLEGQNRSLKGFVARLYKAIPEEAPEKAEQARHVLKRLSLQQGERDRAFYRRTGYVEGPDSLGDLLYRSE